jgi:hypothetical protein
VAWTRGGAICVLSYPALGGMCRHRQCIQPTVLWRAGGAACVGVCGRRPWGGGWYELRQPAHALERMLLCKPADHYIACCCCGCGCGCCAGNTTVQRACPWWCWVVRTLTHCSPGLSAALAPSLQALRGHLRALREQECPSRWVLEKRERHESLVLAAWGGSQTPALFLLIRTWP